MLSGVVLPLCMVTRLTFQSSVMVCDFKCGQSSQAGTHVENEDSNEISATATKTKKPHPPYPTRPTQGPTATI